MAALARPDLIDKLPAWGAAAGATLVGLAFVALPTAWLEGAIGASGVAALLPVAAPPLELAARLVLALGGGALVAIVLWSSLYLLFGEGGFIAPAASGEEGAPAVRRADAHPDAPPRRPLSAAELTAAAEPLPIGRAIEHELPVDLDTPLSALDPAAIPAVPREPVRPVAPLAPGERMQTFVLAPPVPPATVAEAPSIEALLRRLEQGAGRRMVAG